jgi:hypothetical protein
MILRECSTLLSALFPALFKTDDRAIIPKKEELIGQLDEIRGIVERQIAIRSFLGEGLL